MADLHHEYAHCHDAHAQGITHMKTWQAERAFGRGYLNTVEKLMKRVTSPEIIEILELIPAGDSPLPLDDPRAKNDRILCQLHWSFCFDLASNRMWSQAFHTNTFPPAGKQSDYI